MPAPGWSRQHLARILNSAFAEGLLSERTHSHRLDLLFSASLVDQQQLVGDLPRERPHPIASIRVAWSALVESARTLMRLDEAAESLPLLELDRVENDQLLVGRHPRCDVVLTDPSVSRRHAQIFRRDGVWVIQDLASTNGTSVNGLGVGRSVLHPGDVVLLGSSAIQID
jgi:hypothetical protein